jgi:HK97 family phage prohead protease
MTEDLSRAFVTDIEVRADREGRTVHGIVVPFGRIAKVSDGGPTYQEAFQPGAFARTINAGVDRVKLLSHHSARTNPLGRATMLREDAAGLYGEFHVSNTRAGDEALELVRDGALDSFSVGFRPIQQAKRDGVVWRTEVAMREASLVTFPAYEGALIGGVRSLVDLTPEDVAELARMLRESGVAVTPTTDPTAGTSEPPELAAAGDDPAALIGGHSARHAMNRLRAQARKEGGPLS